MTTSHLKPPSDVNAPESFGDSMPRAASASRTSSAIELLSSSSLPMLVQEELERLIMTGELSPGMRLNETDLSARFGTSRGPVREALRALEEAGLVKNEKNRGSFVRTISLAEAQEIYELREALENIIGRRVAQRATAECNARLRAIVEAMQAAADQQQPQEYALLNLQFHEVILEQAGSQKLTETYTRLVKELHLFRMKALAAGGALNISVSEHRDILAAIVSQNQELAGQLLSQHVSVSHARMLRAYQQEHPENSDI